MGRADVGSNSEKFSRSSAVNSSVCSIFFIIENDDGARLFFSSKLYYY